LQGGLGNQLFILTAGMIFALKRKRNLIVDTSLMPLGFTDRDIEIGNINFPISVRFTEGLSRSESRVLIQVLNRVFKIKWLARLLGVFVAEDVGFNLLPTSKFGIRSLHGYFQSYLYFQELHELLPNWDPLKGHNFSANYTSTLNELLELNPIVLHVRLGDYKQHSNSFGLLSEKYYFDAVLRLKELGIQGPIWLISDDPLSAVKKLQSIGISRFEFPELNPLEVLSLMSNAKALVISNSSFSWWAGSLADQKTIIICPEKWFKTLSDPTRICHPNWIRVSSSWE